MKFLFCFLSMISVASAGTIVCKKGADKVTITESQVIVDFTSYSKPRVFNKLNIANGLITDNGLAIRWGNHFGCIRRVQVTTDLREPFNAGYMGTMQFGTCSGGSTPDDICHPDE